MKKKDMSVDWISESDMPKIGKLIIDYTGKIWVKHEDDMTKEELRDIYFGFYDQLNEPERSEAKQNLNLSHEEKNRYDIFESCIKRGFIWSKTPQGHNYWSRINSLVESGVYKFKENKSNIMTREKQEAYFEAFVNKQREVLLRKGNDYSHEDRLSNFKLAGSICGLTPEQNCLSLIATKVARLGVLLGGKVPNNESIQDSVLDLANYAVLLDMIISEKQEKNADELLEDLKEVAQTNCMFGKDYPSDSIFFQHIK